MRVITLRPGEAPKFNEIPALLDTTEAMQHFCGGDICENRIGSSGIFAITSGEISPEDMPISCMIPEMDMLLRGPVVFCRRCGHELAAVYRDDSAIVELRVAKRYGSPERLVVRVSGDLEPEEEVVEGLHHG